MSELAPFTPNKIIPVTDTSKNTTESTPVILLFLPSPFLIVPLYHPQCVVIWNIAAQKIKSWSKHEIQPNYAILRGCCHVRQYAILFRKMLIKQTQKPKSSLLQKSSSLLTVFIFTVQNSVFK